MLQPELDRLRTEGDVLVRSCGDVCPTSETEQSEVEEGNPFSFSPRLIHLHKDHELFEDGDIQRHMYLQDLYIFAEDDKPSLSVSEFACHISGCTTVFSTLQEYEHHYNSLHRNVCCSCHRSLPTARLLDIHIQEWHDSLFTILAEKQDMYQCLVEGCGQRFRTSKHRKDHLIKIHKYPQDFKFDKIKTDRREKKRQQHKDTDMEVVDDVCVSEGVCEDMCGVLSDQPEQGESMEMHMTDEDTTGMAANIEDPSLAVHGTTSTSTDPLKPRYSYRVPANICFGQASVRGFRGRRGKRK
ncbi:zinc finger protein 511 [Sphaeramia orbicularis]|uniref:C2H2-type domain-containing protein n=1 Tax=Sphaeramia orbicularis TaxID=375764 RepID=A0A673AI10_9TELE|nr:zinc finger protein 511 [Sphaeramia orbicularis]